MWKSPFGEFYQPVSEANTERWCWFQTGTNCCDPVFEHTGVQQNLLTKMVLMDLFPVWGPLLPGLQIIKKYVVRWKAWPSALLNEQTERACTLGEGLSQGNLLVPSFLQHPQGWTLILSCNCAWMKVSPSLVISSLAWRWSRQQQG